MRFVDAIFPRPLYPVVELIFPFSGITLVSFDASFSSGSLRDPFDSVVPLGIRLVLNQQVEWMHYYVLQDQ